MTEVQTGNIKREDGDTVVMLLKIDNGKKTEQNFLKRMATVGGGHTEENLGDIIQKMQKRRKISMRRVNKL